MTTDIDNRVVAGFGDEWSRFDQTALSAEELERMFDSYFNIFPWSKLPSNAIGWSAPDLRTSHSAQHRSGPPSDSRNSIVAVDNLELS